MKLKLRAAALALMLSVGLGLVSLGVPAYADPGTIICTDTTGSCGASAAPACNPLGWPCSPWWRCGCRFSAIVNKCTCHWVI